MALHNPSLITSPFQHMVQLLRPNFFNLDFAYARLLFAHLVHDTLGAEREYVRPYMHM